MARNGLTTAIYESLSFRIGLYIQTYVQLWPLSLFGMIFDKEKNDHF